MFHSYILSCSFRAVLSRQWTSLYSPTALSPRSFLSKNAQSCDAEREGRTFGPEGRLVSRVWIQQSACSLATRERTTRRQTTELVYHCLTGTLTPACPDPCRRSWRNLGGRKPGWEDGGVYRANPSQPPALERKQLMSDGIPKQGVPIKDIRVRLVLALSLAKLNAGHRLLSSSLPLLYLRQWIDELSRTHRPQGFFGLSRWKNFYRRILQVKWFQEDQGGKAKDVGLTEPEGVTCHSSTVGQLTSITSTCALQHTTFSKRFECCTSPASATSASGRRVLRSKRPIAIGCVRMVSCYHG